MRRQPSSVFRRPSPSGAASFRLTIAVALLVLGLAKSAPAALVSSTWIDGNSSWNTAGNWSPAVVPSNNATDQFSVNISNGSAVTLDISPTVNGLFIDFLAPPASSLVIGSGQTMFIGANGLLINNSLIVVNSVGTGTLSIQSGATAFNAGTLRASGGGTLSLLTVGTGTVNNTGGTIQAQNGSAVELTGSVVGGTLATSGTGVIRGLGGTGLQDLTNSGLYEASGVNFIRGTVNNTGTMGVSGPGSPQLAIQNGATLNNSGVLQASGGGTLLLAIVGLTGTVNNTGGTIQVDSNSTVNVSGPGFSNFNPATGTLTGGTYRVSGTFKFDNANIVNNAANIILNGFSFAGNVVDQNNQNAFRNFASNSGTLTLQTKDLSRPGNFTNSGTMNISLGSGFNTQGGNYTQTAGATNADGSLFTAGGSVNIQGGKLTGTGTIFSNVQNTGGTVGPGNSPGVLLIAGNYTQGAGGILDIELGGLIAGTQYDQLAVAANALLAGELDVELINGFNPTADASFDILLAGLFGTVSGTFDTLHFPTLPTGTWGIQYFPDLVRVTFDFDETQPRVPLPPTGLLIAIGLVILAIARRRGERVESKG